MSSEQACQQFLVLKGEVWDVENPGNGVTFTNESGTAPSSRNFFGAKGVYLID